ncbi:MAG: rod shape-determining protein MreC [Verrucomicrobia bacterium]|nr:rod shape-determining protein MreC [Verrucomicrobiota bacterium]
MSGKQYVVVISVLLMILVLFNLPAPEALRAKSVVHENLSPFQSVLVYLSRQARGLGWYLSNAWNAPQSEQALRAENAELQREVWRMHGMRAENEQLRELAGMKQQRKERLLLGEVIARGDVMGWWQTVRINRGARDGVRPDMAVFTSRGLVGRTTTVAESSCEVLLITDPTSQVSCRVGMGGATGILRGEGVTFTGDPRLAMLQNVPGAKMEYLPAERAAPEGEEVFTSGLGGTFPEGLPVGRIRAVRMDPSQLYMVASIEPAANLRGLQYVFIIQVGEGQP